MDQLAYMKAWLRINSRGDVSNWTDVEVLESYALLQQPNVLFPDWIDNIAKYMGLAEENPQEEMSQREDPVERLKNEGSNLVKAGIVEFTSQNEKEKSQPEEE